MSVEEPALDLAFTALVDPTRRAVVRLLRQGPLRAGELAEALALTPPGLSRHLRVLRHAGLIDDDEPEHDARVRLYRLKPAGFAPLRDWIDELGAFWGDQLAAFKAHAEALPGTTRPAPKARPRRPAAAKQRR
ncbi:MAG TPA: metalloregulator ArsR/SmtB family transcription factor [Ideonella sp.]|jgi:DNA-binding transcriptional ArsR family regulator|nr:metalloregulator ArsR/SmtB family transcription factor [Ideonella sp.]